MAATQIWTIGSLVTWTTDFFAGKRIDEPRLSAELLLAHSLGCSRMELYTQYERVPAAEQIAAFRELVKQRASHVPVAYLIGKAWFFSLEFAITRDVLIPRPDTETLVEFVIQHARQRPEWTAGAGGGGSAAGEGMAGGGGAVGGGVAILDLCTGSGVIPIALARQLASTTFTASDISEKALAVARQNAVAHKVADRITFVQGDLFDPLETIPAPCLFHVITANPPYIPSAEVQSLAADIRDHEPRIALDGGLDGLDFHRRILQSAKRYLHPSGLLIMEMHYQQGPALQSACTAAGYLSNVRIIRDASGHPRCLVASREA